MTGAGLLGLLLLKHGLLAHAIDFGYSASRRKSYRFWVASLVFHCLAEVAGTVLILSAYNLDEVTLVLLIEQLGLVLSTLRERRSPMHRLLFVHLQCEMAMLGLYGALVAYLTLK